MKTVREEKLAIILCLTREGGTGPVEVTGRADYEVSSDDLTVNRSMELDLATAQVNTIKGFGQAVLQKIKQLEAG